MGAMSFCPFLGFADQYRSAHCTDPPLLGLRAQLQTEFLSSSLGDGRGSLRALGNHLALLFRERGVDVECEGVAIAPEGSDHEMHLVLQEAGYEVDVAREAIQSRD